MLTRDEKARAVEIAKCKQDPYYFLTHWVYTIDTADEESPEKLFPNKPHILFTIRVWQREKTLLVPKSRQMSMTWLFCGLYLHEAMFYNHRLTFFQSKKESDANELILRTYHMYSSLPGWMQEYSPAERAHCRIDFERAKSRINGIPQGADHIRGFQPSGVFSDEAAYQVEVEKMLASIRPAIRSGGRLTMTSSLAPSHFEQMCLDKIA